MPIRNFNFFDSKRELKLHKNHKATAKVTPPTNYAAEPWLKEVQQQYSTLALSHDGKRLAMAEGYRDSIILFDGVTGEHQKTLSGKDFPVDYDCLAFSKDNQYLLMRNVYGGITILNLKTYEAETFKIGPKNWFGAKIIPLLNNQFIFSYETSNETYIGLYDFAGKL